MNPRHWCDHESGEIEIGRFTGDCITVTIGSENAGVSVDRLPEFTAALYKEAGLPEPVILGRLPRDVCDQSRVAGVRIYLAAGGLVGIDGMDDDIPPSAARMLAAGIASLADLAESEPDPAEVAELAEVVRTSDPVSRGYSPDPEHIARAVLRWVRDRQKREAQS